MSGASDQADSWPRSLVALRERSRVALDGSSFAFLDPPPAASNYTGVVILLPDRQGHIKILGVPLAMPCGVSESQLGWAKGFELDQ